MREKPAKIQTRPQSFITLIKIALKSALATLAKPGVDENSTKGTSPGAERMGKVFTSTQRHLTNLRDKDAIFTQMLRLIKAFLKISGQDGGRSVVLLRGGAWREATGEVVAKARGTER
ncbi:hypothetical protein [Bradyrhizobium sp. LA6.12]|uniref:hypothetical protein n=1 Tax=unclassified Bradyrhizobium TaxID=2631580 RepID=UPI0033972BAE